MECSKIKNLFLDYIDNSLSDKNKVTFEQHIMECPDCSKELHQFKLLNDKLLNVKAIESSQIFKNDFNLKLQFEKSKTFHQQYFIDHLKMVYKVAALIIFFVAGTIFGFFIQNHRSDESKLAILENEVKQLKLNISLSMLTESTASDKLEAINYTLDQNQLGKKVEMALYNTLISDDNSTVRIASASVLKHFANNLTVTKKLIQALNYQNDPNVQVELIKILVNLKSKEADYKIKTFIEQEDLDPNVKNFGEKMLLTRNI